MEEMCENPVDDGSDSDSNDSFEDARVHNDQRKKAGGDDSDSEDNRGGDNDGYEVLD